MDNIMKAKTGLLSVIIKLDKTQASLHMPAAKRTAILDSMEVIGEVLKLLENMEDIGPKIAWDQICPYCGVAFREHTLRCAEPPAEEPCPRDNKGLCDGTSIGGGPDEAVCADLQKRDLCPGPEEPEKERN